MKHHAVEYGDVMGFIFLIKMTKRQTLKHPALDIDPLADELAAG